MLRSGGLVGDLPFRRAGEDTINTQVWDIAWTKTDLETTIGQAVAMADKLDFVLLKVSNRDVNMVSEVLKTHQYMVMPFYWYKVDQNMMGTHKPVPAVECLVYGYKKDRVENLFKRAPNNPEKRHNMILGGILRSRFKNEKGEDYNPAQSPIYLWYNLLHDLGGGVDVIIDVCSGTGSASVAALELGYNVIAVEKNETQFEVLTHRFDVARKDLHQENDLRDNWQEVLQLQRDKEGVGGVSFQEYHLELEIRETKKQLAELARVTKKQESEAVKAPICAVCESVIDEMDDAKCSLCGGSLHVKCSADLDTEDGESGSVCLNSKCQQAPVQGDKK
jgi:DNA modification methylase